MKWKYIKNGQSLNLNQYQCTGCGMCREVCPHGVFDIQNKKAFITEKELCMECGACMKNCPAKAIRVSTGVGCAGAIISGMLRGTAPTCGCGEDGKSSACCG